MSATQHTPGPWITDWETGHVTSEQIKTAGKIVCTMPGTNAEGYRLANARLIAAAPDLLAALEQCQTFVSAYIKAGQSRADMAGMPGPYAIDTAIKSAIARATGSEGEGGK